MKAVVWTRYGPPEVLEIQEVQMPDPGDNDLLIRVHATTVTAADCEMRSLRFPFWIAIPMRAYVGFRSPVRVTNLGMELAGEVESVGKNVTRFKAGDKVFATTGYEKIGAYAEYICLPEEPEGGAVAAKPANLGYGEAAAVPVGGLEALHFLQHENIEPGQKMLINGAGGTIGTYAVQLARHFGARVTAVDSSEKLDMLRSLGAEAVIDYTREDFTKLRETYHFIFDVVGKAPFSGCLRSLKHGGRYIFLNPRPSTMLRALWTSRVGSKKAVFMPGPTVEGLVLLRDLIEAGTIRPVIDRSYPLDEIVAAHTYVESGRKIGNVVITVIDGDAEQPKHQEVVKVF